MLRLLTCALSLLFVHTASGLSTEAKNLVKNPGFETVTNDKPSDWIVAGFAEGGKGTLGVSTDKPHGGKYCAVIKGNAEWGTYVSNKIAVKKGQTFELKGYVRVAKGTGTIKFDYFKGNEFIGMTAGENTESTAWTEITVTSELSNFPEATHITCTMVGSGGEYEVYCDDIVLVEKK